MSYYLSSPESSAAGSPYDSSFPSRPQSSSPSFAGGFSQLAKLRQEACRGFDLEDDQEFCPALSSYPAFVQYPPYPASAGYPTSAASPSMSPPTLKSGQITSPGGSSSGPSQAAAAATFQAVGPHRKALEIIDPATGLRVGRR